MHFSVTRWLTGLLAIFLFSNAAIADVPVIELWPNGAPGEKGNLGEEKDTTKPSDKVAPPHSITS